MSKLVKVGAMVAILGTLLAGCGDGSRTVSEVPTDSGVRFNGVTSGSDVSIITDRNTGCKYIYVEYGSGNSKAIAMAPLYRDETHVDCSGK